jgi:hypothetical protein
VKEDIYPVASLQGNNEEEENDIAQEIRVDCSFMRTSLYVGNILRRASCLLDE